MGDACAVEAVGNLKAMCEGIDTRWASLVGSYCKCISILLEDQKEADMWRNC